MAYIELYSKNPEDPDYVSTAMEVDNDFDAYIQQLRNIIFPSVGTIFGAQTMPVDLEAYVFSLGVNPQQLEKLIIDKIDKYCTLSKYFPTTIKVTYARGNIRQVVFIDFVITGQRGFKVKMT